MIIFKAVSAATGAAEGVVKTLAALAYPAELTGWNTNHQRIVLDILGDDRS